MTLHLRTYKNLTDKNLSSYLKVGEVDGIVILMQSPGSDEYNFPNFRVTYNGSRAVFSIDEPALIKGKLPIDVSINILKWAKENRDDLYKSWNNLF